MFIHDLQLHIPGTLNIHGTLSQQILYIYTIKYSHFFTQKAKEIKHKRNIAFFQLYNMERSSW